MKSTTLFLTGLTCAIALCMATAPAIALAAPPSPTPAPASQTPEPTAANDDGILIHIESTDDRDLELFEVTGKAVAVGSGGTASAVSFRRICDAPCDVRIPTTPSYFIGGPRVSNSGHFRVPRSQDQVSLRVRPGRPGVRAGAFLLSTLGLVAVVTGVAVHVLGNRPTGNGLLVGGSLGIAGSVPMFVFGRTKVRLGNDRG